MENNQEHKIDKIFRETFENQEITPPSDAWMGIHTYTIGQEEKKPKVWLRYASLVMLILLISGFRLWYFVNNQVYTSKLLTQKADWTVAKPRDEKSLKTPIVALDNAGRVKPTVELPASVRKLNQLVHTIENSPNRKKGKRTQDLDFHEIVSQIPITENNPLIIVDSLSNQNIKLIEPASYLTDNKVEIIEFKPLIFKDLTDKIQNENEGKIVALEENIIDKKEISKVDSTVYGSKFSLKHPIINFRLGMYNSSVSMNANHGGNNPFNVDVINPNSIYGFSGIIAIAWKLNKKSRISLNSKFISYGAVNAQSKSGATYVDPLSPTNKPSGTFKYNASKDVYKYLTPFGYVTQPIDPKYSFTPKDFDVWFSGSITNLQIGLNYEYDLIAFRNKKGGIPAMEVYGLVGMNVQKIRKYRSNYALFENYNPQMNNFNYLRNYINLTNTNLENGSPIVFGYNTGLGFRFQLSKRFGLNISGNYETNINSWVKDLPFTTRLSVLSVESGFFVNL